jgi:hypothetical protein
MRADLSVVFAVVIAGCAGSRTALILDWAGTRHSVDATLRVVQTSHEGAEEHLVSGVFGRIRAYEVEEGFEVFIKMQCDGVPHPARRVAVARYRRALSYEAVRTFAVSNVSATCSKQGANFSLSAQLHLDDEDKNVILLERALGSSGSTFLVPLDRRPADYPWRGFPGE